MIYKAGLLWLAAAAFLLFGSGLQVFLPKDPVFGDIANHFVLFQDTLDNVFRLLSALLVFSLIDRVFLPDLRILSLLRRRGMNRNVKGIIWVVIFYSITQFFV